MYAPLFDHGAEMTSFQKQLTLPISAKELFQWHEREGAFERLCPPWDPVKVLHKDDHIRDGAKVRLQVKGPMGIPMSLEVIHEGYQKGKCFVDRQVKGPFKSWRHQHIVEPKDEQTATLTDLINYELPLGILGNIGGGQMVKKRLSQLFHYRHQVMQHDVLLHSLNAQYNQGQKLHVAISGASGFIGQALTALFTTGGHKVTIFSRSTGLNTRVWKEIEQVPKLDDIDVVIHLAGESIAQRWTARKKQSIMNSRVDRTQALAQAIADLKKAGKPAPKALICASGVGFYGDCSHDGTKVDENSPLGQGFLAEVCQAWEEACKPAREQGIRVVNARIGVVLAPHGGALAKLLLPFSLGLGGPIGQGKQWMSWVSLHDVVGALYFCAVNQNLSGPVNLCSPTAVTNTEFSKTLGRVLSRPTILPTPPFALKLAYGEMAQETILSGQRVEPSKLLAQGYPFLHTTLEAALRFELGRVKLSNN